MAIFKTRRHNDDPDLMVVELYSDDGVYVADKCCECDLYSMKDAVWDLMKEHNARTNFCTPEQLIQK